MLRAVKTLPVHRDHPRQFEDFRFVYPVISRRSGGLSIGLNVNPDKRCNFDCLYCQVDRSVPAAVLKFDLARAEEELRTILAADLARHPRFAAVPADQRRIKDIALSGDGEPTTLPNFAETIAMVARVKPPRVKIVLITDAGGLDRADVKRGIELLDANDGEVWAKLDAGTEEYFKFVNRTTVPFRRILKNITQCAQERPVVIQSLFLKVHAKGPTPEEVAAYCDRLREIVAAGGRVKLVQVSTLARQAMTMVDRIPAWQFVAALSDAEVDAIAAVVRARTGLTVAGYHGA
jgi:wyosine [tRNA(Phe)-imidazoG37] synthetase (radical SAM superfamily)